MSPLHKVLPLCVHKMTKFLNFTSNSLGPGLWTQFFLFVPSLFLNPPLFVHTFQEQVCS